MFIILLIHIVIVVVHTLSSDLIFTYCEYQNKYIYYTCVQKWGIFTFVES